jgi:tetratricopeptide (TPR) repeat protein
LRKLTKFLFDNKRKFGTVSVMRFIQLNVLLFLSSLSVASTAQNLAQSTNLQNTSNRYTSSGKTAQTHLDLNQFPTVKKLLDDNQTAQAIQQLLSYLDANVNNPAYFNMLGALYLQQKDYLQAAAQFERVVLIEPSNAGAWLDLAIASFEHGQKEVALGYFDYIEQEFKPTPSIQKLIAHYRHNIKIATQGVRNWNHQFDWLIGHDTNANSGLSSSSLQLTHDGAIYELPLDASYRVRSDQYMQKGIGSRYFRQKGAHEFELNFSAHNRHFFSERAYSSTNYSANASFLSKVKQYQLGAAVIVDHLQLNSRSLLNNASVVFNLERNIGACTMNVALDYERRYFLNNVALNGVIFWQQGMYSCNWKQAKHEFNVMGMFRTGNDRSLGFRAGGSTRKNELVAKFAWAPVLSGRLEISQLWAHSKDSEGFSTLLENNAIRQMRRSNTRLSWTYPWNKSLDISINAERNVNDSNISLFRKHSNNYSLGLQKRF